MLLMMCYLSRSVAMGERPVTTPGTFPSGNLFSHTSHLAISFLCDLILHHGAQPVQWQEDIMAVAPRNRLVQSIRP